MKIVKISEIENTSRDVQFTGGNSQRLLIESDGMGFAFMKTNIKKGGPYHWHYPNHLEACYCLSGIGIITDLKTGKRHTIGPEVMYVLDNNEDHTFEAFSDVVLISVFNPPLKGNESHDENGQYK